MWCPIYRSRSRKLRRRRTGMTAKSQKREIWSSVIIGVVYASYQLLLKLLPNLFSLLLLVFNPLWNIGHPVSLLAIVCGLWLVISVLANFFQAFSSAVWLLFSKSEIVHAELFVNHQTDSTPSPCVLCCLQFCVGCVQSRHISAFWSVSPLVQFRLFAAIPHLNFGLANKYEQDFSGSGWLRPAGSMWHFAELSMSSIHTLH